MVVVIYPVVEAPVVTSKLKIRPYLRDKKQLSLVVEVLVVYVVVILIEVGMGRIHP